MSTRTRVSAVAVFLATLSPAGAQTMPIDQLAWMAGCWRLEAGGRVIDEHWMAPAGGLMLGTGRTVSAGRAVDFEFMQIREEKGRLVFIAKPSGQPEAAFPAVKTGPREAIFENPSHDFPQRVMYRLDGESLIGRIEGTQNGKVRSVDFPMRRTPCP